MEIDKQSGGKVEEAQVGERLGLIHRMQGIFALPFHYDSAFNNQVSAKSAIEPVLDCLCVLQFFFRRALRLKAFLVNSQKARRISHRECYRCAQNYIPGPRDGRALPQVDPGREAAQHP